MEMGASTLEGFMDKSENSCQKLSWGRCVDQIGSTGVSVMAVPVLPCAPRAVCQLASGTPRESIESKQILCVWYGNYLKRVSSFFLPKPFHTLIPCTHV